jgi:hypothetical protein
VALSAAGNKRTLSEPEDEGTMGVSVGADIMAARGYKHGSGTAVVPGVDDPGARKVSIERRVSLPVHDDCGRLFVSAIAQRSAVNRDVDNSLGNEWSLERFGVFHVARL